MHPIPSLYKLPMTPATEAVMYGNIKQNVCLKGQDHLRLPRDSANEIIMVTPSADVTYRIIDGEFPTFYRDGYKAYITETKINKKIGAKQIKIIGYSDFRKEYLERVTNRAIKFYSDTQMEDIVSKGQSFIFDTGRFHELYFTNRYSNRGDNYLCEDYMKFLLERIDVGAGHFKKILYVPIDEWIKATGKIGITKDLLNNPISILFKCMIKYPQFIEELMSREVTILFVNAEHGEILKFEFPRDAKEPDKLKSLNRSEIKQLYAKTKIQIERMNLPSGSISNEEDPDDEATTPAPTTTNCAVADELKKELTSGASVLKDDNSVESSDIDAALDDETPEESATDAEIEEVIDEAVETIPELTDENVPDDEKKTIIENEVKKNVYIAKFVPEKSKKQLEYIDVGQTKQARALSQSIDQMKSKIIDEEVIDTDVIDTKNENLRHGKYANADKSYVEKKYIPDISAAVAKLADADIKVFIESIDEEDTSDQLNQKKTLTYHLVDENGKKHTVMFDIPIIRDGCHMYLGGANKMMLHQRIFKPIVKVRPDTVELITMYNKVFVTRHGSASSPEVSNIKKYLTKHAEKYKVKFGNAQANNQKYKTSIEFDDFARSLTRFTVRADGLNGKKCDVTVFFDLKLAEEQYNSLPASAKTKGVNPFTTDNIPCVYYNPLGEDTPYMVHIGEEGPVALVNKLLGTDVGNSGNITKGGKFMFARAKILNEYIPVALFCCYCEGMTTVLRKCEIEHEYVATTRDLNNLTKHYTRPSAIKLADGILVYEAIKMENVLLMNGLKGLGLEAYTIAELDSKDTYIDLISQFYASANQAHTLDNFRMFLIDNKTKEILEDFDQPTDLIEIMFYICRLLANNQYLPENNMNNMRIRSNEIISQIAYQYIVAAYSDWAKPTGANRPKKISVARDCVMRALMSSSLLDEDSVVNPIYQIEKARATTISASTSAKNITLTGINKVDGYGMDKRAYDDSMVGIFGLTSPADANVGIVRDLALEPAVTSTNGYLDVTEMKEVDRLKSSKLFTAVELLTPPGVLHDDPQRSAMMRGQTSKMVMVDKAQPVLMGNKVESILPYHLNNDYCFSAKQSGTVIDMKDGVYVVQYKDGTYDSYDTRETVNKNASDRSYTNIQFKSKAEVGYKFKKGEVLAVEPRAFTFNKYDRGASCNIGVLCKAAIVSLYDTFEDSEPITASLSRKMGFDDIKKKVVSFDANTYVDKICKIGDHVSIGDPLVVFDSSRGDPEIQQYLDNLRKGMADSGIMEELIEANNTTVKAPMTGTISDIKIITTVPVEQLSPSLQKIVTAYHRRIESTSKFLDKYKNPGDNRYYKCGQLLSETTDVVEAKFGKVKGESVGEGVMIEFYIKHHDIIKKGDKMSNYIAAKGVNSHVIPEGLEPWSEYRPEEEVSAFITPISITARKIPSIYPAMFGNKVLIEAKRQMVERYKKARGLK